MNSKENFKSSTGGIRNRIYEIIEISSENDVLSKVYDYIMFATIIVSIIPLCFKEEFSLFLITDNITVSIFIIDYILRWITFDIKCKNSNILSFVKYPLSFMPIIDLLAILPSILAVNKELKLLKILRFFRTLRAFKFLRYSKSFTRIINVLKKEKSTLGAVGVLAIGYIFITGLIMFQVEPDSFNTFFDALYWSTTALTTVGYGDIYPVSEFGKLISMISSLMGIAVVALPAGIITGGYLEEIK
ncbi:MAG: ion transporter [Cellulosilyticaceae bacterium]